MSMTLTLDELAAQAMRLPVEARAKLAEQLVESLGEESSDEVQQAWAAEAIRRRDEVRSGKVKPVPVEEVVSEVRRIVGRE